MMSSKALYLVACLAALSRVQVDGRQCRCLYGQSCWPSDAQFALLESQVSQPLVHPIPPASACYTEGQSSVNCSDFLANTFDGRWRSDQPGSMQSVNWETFIFGNGTIDACYSNTALGFPCEQGSIPNIGVDAHSVEDVQAAVKFASSHDLRLVVKNTGHDYLGRSTARGSFLIWTHHLKNITYHETFVPAGAGPSTSHSNAITLGAGVQWYEAYDAVEAHGRILVGGLSARASVGAAGGWISGGGHSALSPSHGLGIDNALQFTVVVASGRHITANAHSHPDLFWALRGGGGGTFGVITSVTYQTHTSVPLVGAFFSGNFTSPETAKGVITEFIRIHPYLAGAGWGGYSFFDNSSLNAFYVALNTSWEAANATWLPFFDFARNASTDSPSPQTFTVPFDSFFSWYRALFSGGMQVGTNVYLGSRLIPTNLVESDHGKVAEALLAIDGVTSWHAIAGGEVSRRKASSAGINPAWRQAISHVIVSEGWAEGASAAVIDAAKVRLTSKVNKLEALVPGVGAYFNEAFPFEKNPQRTFFGHHYGRLRLIKLQYDPKGLFVVANGVGSEDWDPSLNCRR
ncbi:hypothetical protein EYR40_000292 [Pleurotus pulmonarius]|nr:hypothetical protein EYR40_000292 [Pleurotus pulmonarius]